MCSCCCVLLSGYEAGRTTLVGHCWGLRLALPERRFQSLYLICTEWLLPQLEEDFVKANPDWVKELQIMVTTKVKAEIQARDAVLHA